MEFVEYQSYFVRFQNAVDCCAFPLAVTKNVRVVAPSEKNWTKLQFDFEGVFHDGSRFVLQEIFSSTRSATWKSPDVVLKKVGYTYMNAENSLLFRLDSHHSPVDQSEPLHLDLPGQRHIYDGNALLDGISIGKADGLFALGWITMKLAGKSWPWEGRNAKS